MARHTIDIILILLRARLGHDVKPLTEADKSKLMDVIQTAGQHAVGPALHGGLKSMMDQGKADGWQAVAPMLKILEDQNAPFATGGCATCVCASTRSLRAEDITPVFLKGAASSLKMNKPRRGALCLTWMSDRRTALEDAARALQESGLELAASPDQYRSARHHHFAPLFDRQSGMSVELHRRLLRDATLDRQLMEYSAAQQVTKDCAGQSLALLSPTERLNHVIWHAQVGNLNEALHQINLRDMLDASLLMSTSDIALERLGARADKAGLQQPFANFLAAHDQLVGTRRHPERTKPMAAYRAAKITSPPSQNTRTLELALHYLKTGIRNPSRLLNGLRALLVQGPMGHAKRILNRRTGSSKS
jgi:hypothetical protein